MPERTKRRKNEPATSQTAPPPSGDFDFSQHPEGSAERIIVSQLQKHGGLFDIKRLLSIDGGTLTIHACMCALRVLTDPTHPKNNWRVLVEFYFVGDTEYLRLVPRIPQSVKTAWQTTGTPPSIRVSWSGLLMPSEAGRDVDHPDGTPLRVAYGQPAADDNASLPPVAESTGSRGDQGDSRSPAGPYDSDSIGDEFGPPTDPDELITG